MKLLVKLFVDRPIQEEPSATFDANAVDFPIPVVGDFYAVENDSGLAVGGRVAARYLHVKRDLVTATLLLSTINDQPSDTN